MQTIQYKNYEHKLFIEACAELTKAGISFEAKSDALGFSIEIMVIKQNRSKQS